MKGMRKRRVDVMGNEPSGGGGGRSKKKGAMNTYQKSLYGKGGDGGKKPKKRK